MSVEVVGRSNEEESSELRVFNEPIGRVEIGPGVVCHRVEIPGVLSAYIGPVHEIRTRNRIEPNYRNGIPESELSRIEAALKGEGIRNEKSADIGYSMEEGGVKRVNTTITGIVEAKKDLLSRIERGMRLGLVDDTELGHKIAENMQKVEELVAAAKVKLAEGLNKLKSVWDGSFKYTFRNPKLENVDKDGRRQVVMTADTGVVPMALYFLYRGADTDQRLLDLAMPMGCCAVFSDADGYDMVQIRGDENGTYAKVVGAPVAGMADQVKNEKGEVVDLNMSSVFGTIATEAREECFLTPDILDGMEVVAWGVDKRSIHIEKAVVPKMRIGHKEYAKHYQENVRPLIEGNFPKGMFPERMVVLKKGGLERVVTEALDPIPPTHLLGMMGRIAENWRQNGDSEAIINEKLQVLGRAIQDNYRRIDEVCIEHTGSKYNPKLTPEAQGLPSAISELRRLDVVEAVISYDNSLDV